MTDDIFAKAEASVDAFEALTEDKPSASFSNKKENYWDKTDIDPVGIDVTKFKKSGKSFTVYVHPENDMPEKAYKLILAVANVAMSNGYTFRHNGNKDNVLQNAIITLPDAKYDSYMPWKSFNSDVDNPKLCNPLGYKIAITLHTVYMKLPAAVRAILAKDVNTLLGMEATDPVDFVIAWTDGGDEVIKFKADYKKIGNNTFTLQVCKAANIPVLNSFNSNFIERIKGVVKIKNAENN